jgi:hypothetical protein
LPAQLTQRKHGGARAAYGVGTVPVPACNQPRTFSMRPTAGVLLQVLLLAGGVVLLVLLLLPNFWQSCLKFLYHLVGID